MFPYKKVFQLILLVLVLALIINLILDLVRQYKYLSSQQYLIDQAHDTLLPITVHTIHVRSINQLSQPSEPTQPTQSNQTINLDDSSTESLIIDVKKSMQNRSRQEGTVLNASYNLSIPRKYIFRTKKSPKELFDMMLDNRSELEKLCVDGIRRLEGYITYGYGLNSLIQVAGIIKGFSRLLDNISASEPWVLDDSSKKYWFRFVVYLTRLLTMYQFIGNDKIIKDICVKLVSKLVSGIDQAMGWKLQGSETVFIAIPRVLNLLYSKDSMFLSEISSYKFKSLERYIDTEPADPSDDLMGFEGFYKNLFNTFNNYV